MLPAQPNFSLLDGLACFQALTAAAKPVGVRELARQLGMEPTRVHRLLKTLAHAGYAEQTEDAKYAPGPAVHVLAAQSLFASGLIRHALPALESLQPLGLIVALGVLWRDQVSYLFHADVGMRPIDAIGRVGVFPAPQSGIGLALLAEKSDDVVRALFAEHAPPGFPDGLPALLAQLAQIRAAGYARASISQPKGAVTLAVAVGGRSSAAVALSGRIPDARVPELVAALRRAAAEIAAITRAGERP